MDYKEIHISSRVTLALDPQDPATPAIIWGQTRKAADGRTSGRFSASYDCGMNNGYLDGNDDTLVLTRAELDALGALSDTVDTYHEEARKDCPEYNG